MTLRFTRSDAKRVLLPLLAAASVAVAGVKLYLAHRPPPDLSLVASEVLDKLQAGKGHQLYSMAWPHELEQTGTDRARFNQLMDWHRSCYAGYKPDGRRSGMSLSGGTGYYLEQPMTRSDGARAVMGVAVFRTSEGVMFTIDNVIKRAVGAKYSSPQGPDKRMPFADMLQREQNALEHFCPRGHYMVDQHKLRSWKIRHCTAASARHDRQVEELQRRAIGSHGRSL